MPRIFIALWPDAKVRGQLSDYSATCAWSAQAKPVAAADFHLTLHFLGEVALPLLQPLQASLALDFDAFDLALGQPQLWNEVAILQPGAGSAALVALHEALTDKLQALGFTPDRRSFRPHLTLARHAGDSRLPPPAAMAWHINAYCLAASAPSPAGRYRILQTYAAR